MSLREALEVLDKIAKIASLAGIRGEVDENNLRFAAGFEVDEGRAQVVYVRPSRQTPKGAAIVTFFSPCLLVKEGLLKGVSKEQALDLLARNEQMPFARYGIWKAEGETMIVASVDHLLDTLDPEEFHSHMWHVAFAADMYEREHGVDQF